MKLDTITGFRKQSSTKVITLFLVILFFWGNPSYSYQIGLDGQQQHLERLFQYAKLDYQSGNYQEVIKNLKLTLSFYDEKSTQNENQHRNESIVLKAKIYTLMAATYEQVGSVSNAEKYYRIAMSLLNNETVVIEDISLDSLEMYQRIVLNKKESEIIKHGVIEKPVLKRKKKRLSPFLIIAGIALVGGLVAMLLLKKKKDDNPGIEENYDINTLGIEWVNIPAGEFIMGDNLNEGQPDERPAHPVHLDDYHISKYEVTFKQYDIYCDDSGSPRKNDFGWGRGERPVIYVTWIEANRFCEWLSLKTGKNIHLPYEAQWEKAARGTDQRRYPWGDDAPNCENANARQCFNQTHPIGWHDQGVSFYGIHDMVGNVAEWCYDLYDEHYYDISPYTNPVNEPNFQQNGRQHVVRGGGWEWETDVRASKRYSGYQFTSFSGADPSTSSNSLGFRIVWDR
jgi:formylglycine-generating enzyme required for sulfatase activity